jgi:hypothetical protein
MVLGPDTFRSLVVVPVGEPPNVGSGRDEPGFLDVLFEDELLDEVPRDFFAFEQPTAGGKRRLATTARSRMRRMRNFRSRTEYVPWPDRSRPPG